MSHPSLCLYVSFNSFDDSNAIISATACGSIKLLPLYDMKPFWLNWEFFCNCDCKVTACQLLYSKFLLSNYFILFCILLKFSFLPWYVFASTVLVKDVNFYPKFNFLSCSYVTSSDYWQESTGSV